MCYNQISIFPLLTNLNFPGMDNYPIKILFFSDTHLGYDYPFKPRVQRRRRGHDFFSNYHHVLNIAQEKKVDIIIHGGDLFFRSKVPALIVEEAFAPMVDVANHGIPIYLVPGNHEWSRFPGHLWLAHNNIHIFDKPRTYWLKVGETSIALSGFPFARRVREHFPALVNQTNFREFKANFHFLCLHQTFEGAQVGPSDFTFREGPDNIPGTMIPEWFDGVLSGHIHRAQKLTHTLDSRPLPAPVIYPGSIERTSFAERFESKYFVIIKIDPSLGDRNPVVEYHQLASRPMVKLEIPTTSFCLNNLKSTIRSELSTLAADSIVRIQLSGPNTESFQKALSTNFLRTIAPPTMNISMANQRDFPAGMRIE
jgi:DNA repair exonuclease SbcCD nuclease subunit